MNTPGIEDWLMKVYLDGEEIFTETNIKYREVAEVQISVLFFSTFFGGSSSPDFACRADCCTHYKTLL